MATRHSTRQLTACVAATALSVGCGATQPTAPSPEVHPMTVLAFGDSITSGTGGDGSDYPNLLQKMLPGDRVINAGFPGETAPQGRDRLPGELEAHQPDMLLLLEGVNAIVHIPHGEIVGALSAMVMHAHSQGVEVVLGTLTPISPEVEAAQPGIRAAVESVSIGIRLLAEQQRVPLVDFHRDMEGQWDLFVPGDIHPNARGYTRMAQIWFDALKGEGIAELAGVDPDVVRRLWKGNGA